MKLAYPHRLVWKTAVAACVLAGVGVALYLDALNSFRTVTLTLLPEEVQALSERSAYPVEDLWERVRAIGVSGVLLRAQNLDQLLEQGTAVRFSRSEAEKWRIAGLMAPNSPLKADSVWIRDPAVVSRVASAARQQGLAVSTPSYAGMTILQFSGEVESLRVGFDPHALESVRAPGFIPVLRVEAPGDVLAPEAETSRVVGTVGPIYLLACDPEDAATCAQKVGRLLSVHPQAWAAVGPRSRALLRADTDIPLARWMIAGETAVSAAMGSLWRKVLGRRARLMVVHLSSHLGVEANLDVLRDMAVRLKHEGFSLQLYPQSSRERTIGILERGARCALAMLLAVLAPLWAMRYGLHVLRRMQGSLLLPQASPVLELAAGSSVVMVVALLVGLVLYGLAAFPDWRLGLTSVPWLAWSALAPLALGVASLYVLEPRQWLQRLRRPITYLAVLKMIGIAVGFLLVLNPGLLARWLGLGYMEGVGARLSPALWWLDHRWREVLIGVPCLWIGFWKQLHHLQEPKASHEGKHPDPRPWLLAGMLAPIGVIQVFGQALVPVGILIVETFFGFFLGAGAAIVAMFTAWAVRKE